MAVAAPHGRRLAPGRRGLSGIAAARVFLGFAIPPILYLASPDRYSVAAVAFVLAGELLDRFDYYLQLRVADPGQMMVNFAANRTGIREIDPRS